MSGQQIVSVVMPVYNGEKHLKEAIDSILNQTFTDFEFIIINDGSTDSSESIVLSYADERIRYVKNDVNLQIVKSLNKAIELAKGQYIARMDADDISLQIRLEEQVRFMQSHPEIDVCGTWVHTFGDREETWEYPLSHDEIKALLLLNSALAHPSIIVKRSMFSDFSFSNKYLGAEDYYLWVNSIDHKVFSNIPKVLYRYRLHDKQTEKIVQRKSTDNIREETLSKVGCEFSDEELSNFFAIANYQSVSIKKADALLMKILKTNREFGYFEQKALEKVLAARFLTLVNQRANRGLITWLKFHNSTMKSVIPFSFYAHIKLFTKCLIKYSHG